MANCKSCLNSYVEDFTNLKQPDFVCIETTSGISACPVGDHECAAYKYEPGTDEPAKTKW